MYRFIIILICSVNCLSGISGTIDPRVPDSKYIEYAKSFDCVGKICGKYANGSEFCASAVVIDSHHILTAAHVAKDSEFCILSIHNKRFCVKTMIIHKDFDGPKFGDGDIAIGYIEEDIGLESYPELYAGKDEEGKICAISGFGITGTFLTGANLSDNKQRAGNNHIDYITANLLICSPSRPGKNGTQLEFLIASGDSGGGLFIDGKLAGINSCVMSESSNPKLSSTYDTESGHTRVSSYIEWIESNKHEKK